MHYVAIVTAIALIQFQVFGILVGRARARYGVPAPATSGNEVFERYFRAHANTLEQLVALLPSMWVFAHYASATWAAAFGAVFIVGRAIYFRSYVRDPKSRSLGFALTAFPTLIMMVGILVQAVRALMAGQ